MGYYVLHDNLQFGGAQPPLSKSGGARAPSAPPGSLPLYSPTDLYMLFSHKTLPLGVYTTRGMSLQYPSRLSWPCWVANGAITFVCNEIPSYKSLLRRSVVQKPTCIFISTYKLQVPCVKNRKSDRNTQHSKAT